MTSDQNVYGQYHALGRIEQVGSPAEVYDTPATTFVSQFVGSSPMNLIDVVVPNIAPALAALGVLLFISAWNEYFWPLVVFHTPNAVLQIGIATLLDQSSTNYGAVMAMSGLSTVPSLVLYAVLQRRVVNAFVRSGIR
jgi:sn-glycerol 3-phosphate transport system permease protein